MAELPAESRTTVNAGDAASADLPLHINRLTTTGLFLSALAHELNNPLQVISGMIELLENRTDLPADVQTKLQKMGAQATRAGETIRMVQGFIRDRNTEIRRVDLRDAAGRALALRRYPLTRANIAVTYEPPPSGAAVVSAVEGLLVLALVNLLINAEQALAGRSGAQLRLEIASHDGVARIRVADNGPGIDPSLRERVFEPFFSTRPPEAGLGLGLPVARQVAERFGGRLTLEETATGASFAMELPVLTSA